MIRIGTCGWYYRHWIGCFYPPDLPPWAWLPFYAAHFPTVEINRSFYDLPPASTFRSWARRAGEQPGFCFAVKAPRTLTHGARLYGPEAGLARLAAAAGGLGPALGPVLYQCPPGWPVDLARLAYFLDHLPPGQRAAFEFRDPSWYAPAVHDLLERAGAALVRAVGGVHYTPLEVPDAGPFRYIRVHGGLYGTGLTDGELEFWAARLAAEAGHRDIYVNFNNDPDCHAVNDARRLRALLGV